MADRAPDLGQRRATVRLDADKLSYGGFARALASRSAAVPRASAAQRAARGRAGRPAHGRADPALPDRIAPGADDIAAGSVRRARARALGAASARRALQGAPDRRRAHGPPRWSARARARVPGARRRAAAAARAAHRTDLSARSAQSR